MVRISLLGRAMMPVLIAASTLLVASTPADAGIGPFPCSTFKPTSHQWERSCKGSTERYGSSASGIAYHFYQSRTVPGLSAYSYVGVTVTDTVADGSCAWFRLDTAARPTVWYSSCGKGTSRKVEWDDSVVPAGAWARAYICTGKAACSMIWYQDMTDPGPKG